MPESKEAPESIAVHKSGNPVVDWAVHNAWFTVSARISMILLGVTIPVVAFMAIKVWESVQDNFKEIRNTSKETVERFDKLNERLVDIKILQMTVDTSATTLGARIDAQGRRIDRHDRDIDEIKTRIYQLPPSSPIPGRQH